MLQKNRSLFRLFIVLLGLCLLASHNLLLMPNTLSWGKGPKQRQKDKADLPATLGLDSGLIEFVTPNFIVKLVRASQTIAVLQPKGEDGFDFTPNDLLNSRAADGFHHLGDINLRLRIEGSKDWKSYSSASARKTVIALPSGNGALASADLTPTLTADCPLHITRTWRLDKGNFILRFDLKNKTEEVIQIGALGIPMIFNNILTRRTLEQAHEICSFFDPYIGQDAGYLQVTRLNGHGPALIAVSDGKTPFEAYRVLDEPMRHRQTFEGTFEWMIHTQAYAENEWKNAESWNPPTMVTIAPGQQKTYGIRFLLSPEIRDIEKTLVENGRPVTVGIPGYILPMDLEGKLFLSYKNKVRSIDVHPAGAINISKMPALESNWKAFQLKGKKWGRARITVTYADGLTQSIHYYVIKPSAQVVSDLGNFLFTAQWFEDPADPFLHSPSVISYDREADRKALQDSRVWIAGLGDEGGSGSWVAAAMKQLGLPDKEELAKYEEFVNKVLWGRLQYSQGELKYGVRKSLFYYQPEEMPEGYYDKEMNWKTWTSWDKKGAEIVNRSYNYPHVAAAYWTMYRLARNCSGLVITHPWSWYLERAFQTGLVMARFAPDHSQHGQMEGTIFLKILIDLKREGWNDKATALETEMKKRADIWNKRAYPFGSEMAWDSTGQEEVYAWCKYFGYDDKAMVSLNSIIGYMPAIPHWGYNGNARRYWDFLYGGKLRRIERQLHHYGSGLNAIPILSEYREHPEDIYLLRIGYGGTMGALTNIDQEGFASAAFHSFPSTLKWDAYSGDYGPNFFGHALNTATYVINHSDFGWQTFGGNIKVEGEWIKVKPLDSFRKRVYLSPYGLWLTLDAGMFEKVEINTSNKTIRLGFAPATQHTQTALLLVEQPAAIDGVGKFKPVSDLSTERGAFCIPLKSEVIWIELKD